MKINHQFNRVKHLVNRCVFASIFASLLISCSLNRSNNIDLSFDSSKGSGYYLSQLSTSSGDDAVNWRLLSARALLLEKNISQTEVILAGLPTKLSANEQNEKVLLTAELAANKKQPFDLNQLNFSELSEDQKIRFYQIKILLDGNLNDINAQVRDYVELGKYGSTEQKHQAINNTWTYLISLSDADINQILVYVNESILQGWIDLRYRYNFNVTSNSSDNSTVEGEESSVDIKQTQLEQLKSSVHEWQIQYASHPAALYLPRTIFGEENRLPEDESHKRVALFLPLSGSSQPFGDAVRLGYSDANQSAPLNNSQDIQFYDTNSRSIDDLVQQAKNDNVNVIVGPLLKQNLVELINKKISIPVLALNKIEEYQDESSMCIFTLSPENEAQNAADHIASQGKQIPLLIVQKNQLGDRIIQSFAEEWHKINPESEGVYVQYFESEDELSNKINSGIGIELEGMLLDTTTAVERPFDAIYVYSSHSELARIKSMLEMSSNKFQLDNNGDFVLDKAKKKIPIEKKIPNIYASSRSNIADTTQDFRYDMENVQFSDIPLIVKNDTEMANLPDFIKDDYSLTRLYAMGLDAWQLAANFSELKSNLDFKFNGATGILSVSSQCDINRTLSWEKYSATKNIVLDDK